MASWIDFSTDVSLTPVKIRWADSIVTSISVQSRDTPMCRLLKSAGRQSNVKTEAGGTPCAFGLHRGLRRQLRRITPMTAALAVLVACAPTQEAAPPGERIVVAERTIALAKLAAPKCTDEFTRGLINSGIARTNLLLENAKSHQEDAAKEMSIASLINSIGSMGNDAESCSKIMLENRSIKARCNNPIRIGMTKAEVLTSDWCEPSHVNTTITRGHKFEQWLYEGARISNEHDGYLYFQDGVLTVIETR